MDTWNTKKIFRITTRAVVFAIIALFFTVLALISLGALIEDNHTAATILAHFAAKSLITLFAFFAAKIPLLALLKLTTINGWFSALFWRETVNPESIKALFSFSTDTAYFNKTTSFLEVFSSITKTRKMSAENRVKFFINPFSLLIAAIKIIENFCVFIIDVLPPQSLSNKPSFSIYRAVKGFVILVCELLNILLTLFEPIANIPYYLLHFFAITIPDGVMWFFFEFKAEKERKSIIAYQPSSSLTIDTTRYINQKLLYSKKTAE